MNASFSFVSYSGYSHAIPFKLFYITFGFGEFKKVKRANHVTYYSSHVAALLLTGMKALPILWAGLENFSPLKVGTHDGTSPCD